MTRYEEVREHLSNNQYTWLITGVAGFIGSNLLEILLILNQKVVGLDNFVTGYQNNIDQAVEDAEKTTGKSLSDKFVFFKGNIRELKDCQQACNGVDYVLHQAALGSVPRSIEDPINTNRTNIDGFLNMLVAARDEGVKNFVYAASSSTYGDHPKLPKVEDKIGNPLSSYAITKLVNELYANVFAKTYNFNSIGLRYFNIFGKRQDPDGAYAAVIPKWISNILKAEDVFINGDGKTSRDFCYIDNAIQLNLLAALTNKKKASNQVYNVALNERTTLKQLYEMIQLKLNKIMGGKLVLKDPIYRDFRPGDVRHSQASINKAIELLDYAPSHLIGKGLDEALDWYVNKLQ